MEKSHRGSCCVPWYVTQYTLLSTHPYLQIFTTSISQGLFSDVGLYHGEPVALDLQDWLFYTLQQIIDEVDFGGRPTKNPGSGAG